MLSLAQLVAEQLEPQLQNLVEEKKIPQDVLQHAPRHPVIEFGAPGVADHLRLQVLYNGRYVIKQDKTTVSFKNIDIVSLYLYNHFRHESAHWISCDEEEEDVGDYYLHVELNRNDSTEFKKPRPSFEDREAFNNWFKEKLAWTGRINRYVYLVDPESECHIIQLTFEEVKTLLLIQAGMTI